MDIVSTTVDEPLLKPDPEPSSYTAGLEYFILGLAFSTPVLFMIIYYVVIFVTLVRRALTICPAFVP